MSQEERPKPLRLAELPTGRASAFSLVPGAALKGELAGELGLLGLRKLRFEGRLVPRGRRDWALEARLGATVVQPCVVTLEPVTTRIEEEVTRLYLADYAEPEEAEAEMPEDESAEPLPATLDLWEVMREALALALPPFPRAEGAELGEAVFAEPGVAPLTDAEVKPFAGLAGLKKRLEE